MIDDKLSDGFALSINPFIQAGAWQPKGEQLTRMAIFRSSDDGKNWDRKAISKERGELHALCINPKDKNIIYSGGFFWNEISKTDIERRSRLYKSVDGGNNWEEIGTSVFGKIDDESVMSVSLSPFDYNKVYAATGKGIYISDDGGKNWNAPSQKLDINVLICNPKDKNILYACGKEGFWISKDGGKKWEQNNKNLPVKELISMDYDKTNKIIYAGSRGGGLFRLKLGK